MDRFEELYASTPPAPPPKPGSHEVSAINTPITSQSPRPPPPVPDQQQHSDLPEAAGMILTQNAQIPRPQAIPDPGDQWLPRFLEDKPYGFPNIPSASLYLGAVGHWQSDVSFLYVQEARPRRDSLHRKLTLRTYPRAHHRTSFNLGQHRSTVHLPLRKHRPRNASS